MQNPIADTVQQRLLAVLLADIGDGFCGFVDEDFLSVMFFPSQAADPLVVSGSCASCEGENCSGEESVPCPS